MIVPLLFAASVSSQIGDVETIGFGSTNADFQREVEDALKSGSRFSGAVEKPTVVTLPSGPKATVEGAVSIELGAVTADHLEFAEATLTKVGGFAAVDGGFVADTVDRLELGTTLLTHARGVSLTNGLLEADFADGFKNLETKVTLATDLKSVAEKIQISGAGLLISGPISVRGVPAATVSTAGATTKIDPVDHSSISVRIAGHPVVRFEGMGSLSVTADPTYLIAVENGSVLVNGPSVTETIDTKTTSSGRLLSTGFERVVLGRESGYFHIEQDQRRDFVIYVPEIGAPNHVLCLIFRNPSNALDACDSHVDIDNGTIVLGGIIDYRRYRFSETGVQDLLTQLVYRSFDKGNRAVLTLDDDGLFVRSLDLSNPAPRPTGLLSWVNLGRYAVYEEAFNGTITRYGRFLNEPFPDVVERYSSKFQNRTRPPILIQNETLRQIDPLEHEGPSTVTAVCSRCAAADDRLEELSARVLQRSNELRWCNSRG